MFDFHRVFPCSTKPPQSWQRFPTLFLDHERNDLFHDAPGPTIVSMPALAQEAGWFSLFLVQAVVAAWTVSGCCQLCPLVAEAGFSCLCGLMLIEAMRCIPGANRNQTSADLFKITTKKTVEMCPGNHHFEQTIEFLGRFIWRFTWRLKRAEASRSRATWNLQALQSSSYATGQPAKSHKNVWPSGLVVRLPSSFAFNGEVLTSRKT